MPAAKGANAASNVDAAIDAQIKWAETLAAQAWLLGWLDGAPSQRAALKQLMDHAASWRRYRSQYITNRTNEHSRHSPL